MSTTPSARFATTRTTATVALAAAATLLAACPRDKDDEDAGGATQAIEVTDTATSEAAFLMAGADVAEAATTADQAAEGAVQGAPTWYQPSTCVTATRSGATVTYALDDCTGPLGLRHVTGTLVVDYALDAAGLHAHATATGLLVDGATLDLDATGLLAVDGDQRTLTVSTTGQGTGPRGTGFARTGDYTVRWTAGGTCLELDGAWTVSAIGLEWSLAVTDFAKCAGQCPEAGGRIDYQGPFRTITVAIDGDGDAAWTSVAGDVTREGTVELLCL